MKKMICLMLALTIAAGLLAGCAAGEKTPETEAIATIETTVPTETRPVSKDSAVYEVVKRDDSYRNENGDVLVGITYEQVVLAETFPEWAAINQLIAGDYAAFLDNVAYVYDEPVEDVEARMESMGADYGDFFTNCVAEVVQNAEGIFSIRLTRDWFMGGVFNVDSFGLTFDLNTGEALTLDDLLNISDEELKSILAEKLMENAAALFDTPEAVLASYTMEDYIFYVENGEVVITFPTYSISYGAAGPITVHTGLMATGTSE